MADILAIPSDACGCSACTPVQVTINQYNAGPGTVSLGGPTDPLVDGLAEGQPWVNTTNSKVWYWSLQGSPHWEPLIV